MKKKIMVFLLAFLLATGISVGLTGGETVQAEELMQWGHFGYVIKDDGTIEIKRGPKTATTVEIPATIDGRAVTSIGQNVFGDNKNLTSVKIPNGVTSIGEEAFDRCKSLTSVELPDSLTSIGRAAFRWCSSLTDVKIPGGVTLIAYQAFYDCTSLASVEISSGVTDIGPEAFARCESLASVNIPNSVTTIWHDAFACTSLTSVEIPNSVTAIGDNAFGWCNLVNVEIPNSVISIGQFAFAGCKSLTSIKIPGSVTSIGWMAFSQCNKLKDIYYGGSQKQWNQNLGWIAEREYWEKVYKYKTVNDYLQIGKSVTIHFAVNDPDDQTITAKNSITKTYGDKPFSLKAKVNTKAALTYASKDKKVATVDKNGKVTIKGCGITTLTITAKATGQYKKMTKNVKLTVKPKKVALSTVKSARKQTATVTWKKDTKASGYIIQLATDSKFKKNKVQVTVSKNKTVSTTIKKVKAGKKYYVRVCAYAKSGKTKVQGDWSKAKTVKVKK